MSLKLPVTQSVDLLTSAERWQGGQMLLLVTLTGLIDTIGLTPILPLLTVLANPDTATGKGYLNAVYATLQFSDVRSFMIFLAGAVLATVILTNALNAWTARRCLRFSLTVGHALSVRMMHAYLAQPYVFFLNENSSKILIDVVGRVYDMVHGVLAPGLQVVARSILVGFIFFLLVAVNPALSLGVGALVGGGYAGAYWLLRDRVRRYGAEANVANELRGKFATETFGGIKEIKAYGREAFFAQRFSEASSRYTAAYISNGFVSLIPRHVLEVFAIGGMLVAILLLLFQGTDLSGILPVLALYAFAAYRLLPAIQQIFHGAALIKFSASSVNALFMTAGRLKSVRNLAPILPGPDEPAMPFIREFAFERVEFAYPDSDTPVIHHLSLSIPKNTSVGVVGTTGSGKTTLIDLAMALLAPSAGRVTVDGRDIVGDERGWRQRIGYVPQSIYLADTSVASNIAFGEDEEAIDSRRMEEAARMARIDEFVRNELPEGYRTVVGERGVRLSGGQRQRIGIARALYRRPEFLVFDEATSALDNQTEAAIVEAIQSLSHSVTMLIVAHRLSTVRACDEIIMLERGEIADHGSYEALYSRSPAFRALADP